MVREAEGGPEWCGKRRGGPEWCGKRRGGLSGAGSGGGPEWCRKRRGGLSGAGRGGGGLSGTESGESGAPRVAAHLSPVGHLGLRLG